MRMSLLVACLVVLWSAPSVEAAVRSVPFPHATIQAAIDAADPGDTIVVASGNYPEQIVVTKPLSIEGDPNGATIVRPETVVVNSTNLFSGAPIASIVLVDGTGGVILKDLTVDGEAAGAQLSECSPGFAGIFYRAAAGAIQLAHVTRIVQPAALGCQAVFGIFVQSGYGGPELNSNVTLTAVTVDDYGKNGITCNEAGTACTVVKSTITGLGASGVSVQNGIQVGFGAYARVTDNVVTGNVQTSEAFNACGILFFEGGGGIGIAQRTNTLSGNEREICTAGRGPR